MNGKHFPECRDLDIDKSIRNSYISLYFKINQNYYKINEHNKQFVFGHHWFTHYHRVPITNPNQ